MSNTSTDQLESLESHHARLVAERLAQADTTADTGSLSDDDSDSGASDQVGDAPERCIDYYCVC